MPKKRTHAEIESGDIDSCFDLIFNASNAMDYGFNQSLTAIKEQILFDLSLKEETIATTDFTVPEAIHTFGLKYEESDKNYRWDIEMDVGKEEFPTTPCIGETLMPSC
jgi:hypothetical protein